jgi:hypothetical protein
VDAVNNSQPLDLAAAIPKGLRYASAAKPTHTVNFLEPVAVLSSFGNTVAPLLKEVPVLCHPASGDAECSAVEQALRDPIASVLRANLGNYISVLIELWHAPLLLKFRRWQREQQNEQNTPSEQKQS